MRRYPVTPNGFQAMKAALRQLLEVDRPANVRAIEEARAHGDLSENAEYDFAKDEQGKIAARIRDLESKVGLAEVIDPSTLKGDRVMFGATVTLEDVDTEEELVYQLVGSFEADIKEGRISVESPIGRALMGKEEGDEVIIQVPKGRRTVDVVSVEYK
ncbi:MAG: transcription elongation factor GreA [Myxococcota bacterium]|nr:transcription elongation factor GreA [Myxococcota bacterium]